MSKTRLLAMRPGAVLLNAGRGAPWTAPPWRRCCAPAACWARDWTLPIRNLCPQDTPSGRPPASSSPHTAGGYNHMEATLERIKAIFLDNLRRYVEGRTLRNQVR